MSHPRAPHSEDDGYEAHGSRAFARFLSGLAAFSVGLFVYVLGLPLQVWPEGLF